MPNRLARRRPQARSSPVVDITRAGDDCRPAWRNSSKPDGETNRVPTRTSSSGNPHGPAELVVDHALSTVSRFDVRFTDASPMMTLGVPPMRSSVLNMNPYSRPFSRANVTSTQVSACLDRSPAS